MHPHAGCRYRRRLDSSWCGVDERQAGDLHRLAGAVRVTEKFFARVDPSGGVLAEDQARAIAWIDEQLDSAEKAVDLARVCSLVRVAGTVTTLTARAWA